MCGCSCTCLLMCVAVHVCACSCVCTACRGQRMTALGKIFTCCAEKSMSGSEHNLGSEVFPPCGVQRLNSGFHNGSKCLCPLSHLAGPHVLGVCGGEARSLVTWSSMGRLGCSASETLGSTGLPELRSLTQIESTSLPKDWPTWWHKPALLVVRMWRRRWRGQGRPWLYQALSYPSPQPPRMIRCKRHWTKQSF